MEALLFVFWDSFLKEPFGGDVGTNSGYIVLGIRGTPQNPLMMSPRLLGCYEVG